MGKNAFYSKERNCQQSQTQLACLSHAYVFRKQNHRKKSPAFCHSFRFYEKYGIRKQNLYVPKVTQKVENSRTKSGTTISAHISQALQLRETKTLGQDRIQKFFLPFLH